MYATTMTAVGTLITPINKKRLADGTHVVHFRVACNERRYDRTVGGWVDGDTLYISVSCWRRLAENVHASFVVGDPIMVRGRVFTRSYDKDGRRNSVTEIEADAVGPDLARCTAAVRRTRPVAVEGVEELSGTPAEDAAAQADEQDAGWPDQPAAIAAYEVTEAVPAVGH